MPAIIRGNTSWYRSMMKGDLGYRYPRSLPIQPGSPLHNRIVDNIWTRAQDSFSVMSRRHPDWRKLDQTLTAYIYTDEAEEVVKERDERRPVSIVVPYSYATLETLLTYWTATFLNYPYFKYEGVTSDDIVGALMLERVVELQCMRNKVGLALHTQFRDALTYGFGVTSPTWMQHMGKRRRNIDGVITATDEILFEGNKLRNIDPYLYLPDPSVPIHQVQDGGFVGWVERTNYTSLLTLEQLGGGDVFNVRYLEGQSATSNLFTSSISDREKKVGGDGRDLYQSGPIAPVDVIWMYVNLVPSSDEWQLGPGQYPEKWLFAVAGDSLVLEARPLGLDHNLYPVSICAPDYDGYSISPVSKIEMIYGLQGVLDFLFNSHVANVRKAINDMIIVDPFLVNMGDMKTPGPGKLIRTRRAAWGRGVKDVAMQLQVADVTRGHMADSSIVIDIIQRASSAVDALQGIMRSGSERRSATEARDTRMGAVSRLAKSTKIASIMTMHDLGYMFASHTQQLMSRDIYVNTMGMAEQELLQEYGIQGSKLVTPESLLIDYDCRIGDGSTEFGEFAQEWINLYQILATNPNISTGFDMLRIFKHISRLMGAKSINEFVQKGGGLNVKTATDQLIQSQVQKGNMLPISEVGGAGV